MGQPSRGILKSSRLPGESSHRVVIGMKALRKRQAILCEPCGCISYDPIDILAMRCPRCCRVAKGEACVEDGGAMLPKVIDVVDAGTRRVPSRGVGRPPGGKALRLKNSFAPPSVLVR